MPSSRCVFAPAALGLVLATAPAFAQGSGSLRPHAGMLRYPALSQERLAFLYAGKLWTAPRAGGLASPCAAPPGAVLNPRFSPDGRTLAFTASYDGNPDLYTVPVDGGTPTRVTHHPGFDRLCNWTPDGRLLYSSNAFGGIGRTSKLLVTSAAGGMPTMLPVPYGEDAAISPDGRYLAYTPSSTNDRTWKRYRGGWAQDIWLFDLREKTARKVTDWEGTDTLPMWSGTTLYYLSDQGSGHRLNVWAYDTKGGRRRQVTAFSDYDVKWPSIGPGALIFQHGAELRLLDLASAQSKAVEIRIPGDRPALRTRGVNVSGAITAWSLSPSAKRVAVDARGDIWTLPAKDGSPRNLTRTSGVRERDPAWSPDGKWIAYLSDATGEYELYLISADGKGEPRQLTRDGTCFRFMGNWSPDSKRLLFTDKKGALHLHTVESGRTTQVEEDPLGNPMSAVWSPDSRWLAYEKALDPRANPLLWLYEVETDKKQPVTSGMFRDARPAFDRKGEFLFYASSRRFQTPLSDDNQTTWVYAGTEVLIAVPLRADVASPFLPKSDEEPAKDEKPAPKATVALAREMDAFPEDDVSGKWTGTASGTPAGDIPVAFELKLGVGGAVSGTFDARGIGQGSATGRYDAGTKRISLSVLIAGAPEVTFEGSIDGNRMTAAAEIQGRTIRLSATRESAAAPPPAARPDGAAPPAGETKPPRKVTIDFEGFEARGIALPIAAGNFGRLAVNAQNQLLFVRQSTPIPGGAPGIKLFDLNDPRREEKLVAAGASAFDITPDGKKLLVPLGRGASIQDASAGAAGEAVPTAGMSAQIDPRAEWKQLLLDAWRIERDYFYDPNMHGVDWKAVRVQYEKMLEDCNSRADVGYVLGEMIAELNVGHAYYGGPDSESVPPVPVGMLGADFALENGAYRLRKILRGAPWDTDVRGPLAGVAVKEGDYLLAVNGLPVNTSKDPWAAFVGQAERALTLTVSAKPALDSDAREVVVRPVADESELRYRAWIERNRAYVAQKTGGKVGYIYVPNTGTDGQSDLLRQFVGQTAREALIIDDRWNGGGQIPTRFIELLNRPITNYWARRDGADWPWPPDAHQGPKCMLINGLAGSGGDAFPWYFRQAGLGKLVGTRTWGGLVGISGNPELMDGSVVTAPTFAFYEKDGTWAVEGHGVDPDIEAIDDPGKMQGGADPQLDAAIALMLDELKKKPYVAPKRPPYPNRKGMGIEKKDI